MNAGVSTMKKTWMLTALAALSGSVGCGSQAGPDYEGEPLFAFRGKVVVQNPEAPGALVPAIAYAREYQGSDAIFISEASYEGTFPNDVRLKLFEPPPPEAIGAIDYEEEEQLKDEPRVAAGYITAVPPGTPSILRWDNEMVATSCWPVDEQDPEHECTKVLSRCSPGYVPGQEDEEGHCYTEESTCAPDLEECTLTRAHGNMEYAKPLEEKFGGLSRDVMLLYLDAPAAARTYVSHVFNRGRAMNAGYNLVRWEAASTEDIDAFKSCEAQVLQEMVGPYNEANGTEFERLDQLPGNTRKHSRELFTTMESRGCPLLFLGGRIEVVDVDRERSVTIEIAAGVPPYGLFGREQP